MNTSCGIPIICREHGKGLGKCEFYEPITVSDEQIRLLKELCPIDIEIAASDECRYAARENSAGNRSCENAIAISAFIETLFPNLKCNVEGGDVLTLGEQMVWAVAFVHGISDPCHTVQRAACAVVDACGAVHELRSKIPAGEGKLFRPSEEAMQMLHIMLGGKG